MSLQALIFDVDGTLAETERDGHRVAFNAAFAAAGLPWQWDEALYGELLAVTGGKERIRHFCERFDPQFLARPDLDSFVQGLHKDKTARYVALVNRGALPLRPGVARLIDEARQAGIRLAIATTTSLDNVTALLEASLGAGSAAWFDAIGAGDIVPRKKPAPDIYLWVLERLGLAADACLALEDSANGVRAARGAGLPTLVTEAQYTRGEDFAGALAVLPDLATVTLGRLQQIHGAAAALPARAE
jgi:beta-phosphoglucomutase-like phosphatase (HAD superfamily)